MQQERTTALTVSGVMHAVLILLMIVGLPSLFFSKKEPEPFAISVEILPLAPISNMKPSETPPLPKPKEETKRAEAKKSVPATQSEPPPPPKPEEKPEEKKPEEKPKPEEKKPEEKKPEEKKEKPKDDLASILQSVQDQAKKEQADKPNKEKETASQPTTKSNVPYDPSLPVSQSLRDSIQQQLTGCWSPPVGAKNAENLIIPIQITLNRDGSVITVIPAPAAKARMAGDPFYRAAADSAIRAVHKCDPLKITTTDKYEAWSFIEFNFDPKDMLQ